MTRALPKHDQFDAWRQFNSEIIDLLPVDDPADGFDVEHRWWTFGDLVLAKTGLPGALARKWHHRKRSYLDHWCVVIARGADGRGETSPDVGVRSLTRPYEGCGRDASVICLYVPRDRLPKAVNALESEEAALLSAGVARILTTHLETLVREIDGVPRASCSALAEATCALLAACLSQTPERVALARPSMHSALRERARKIVAANLASPELGPNEMARLLFVSRSKLYRIFEADGGVARFIQRERLAHTNRILTQATTRISISALSLEVGFRDHAAFSRAYKNEYGICPREARDATLAQRLAGGAGEPGAPASSPLAMGRLERSAAWTPDTSLRR